MVGGGTQSPFPPIPGELVAVRGDVGLHALGSAVQALGRLVGIRPVYRGALTRRYWFLRLDRILVAWVFRAFWGGEFGAIGQPGRNGAAVHVLAFSCQARWFGCRLDVAGFEGPRPPFECACPLPAFSGQVSVWRSGASMVGLPCALSRVMRSLRWLPSPPALGIWRNPAVLAQFWLVLVCESGQVQRSPSLTAFFCVCCAGTGIGGGYRAHGGCFVLVPPRHLYPLPPSPPNS
jgi:hypothetical protein